MTNPTNHVPQQHSMFSGAVVNVFTGAMILVAGFLTFAQFLNV
jgi:hypothetical protein